MRAQRIDRLGAGRIVGEELHGHAAGAERDRLRGIRKLVGSGGDLERAAADVEEQDLPGSPAEPAAHREEREPRLGLATEHLQWLAQGLFDAGDHRCAVRRLAHRRRRGGQKLVDPFGLGDRTRLGDRRDQGAHALFGDRAVGVEIAHETQHGALARGRERPPSRAHIGDEQVDGVRADVEDSEAHSWSVARSGIAPSGRLRAECTGCRRREAVRWAPSRALGGSRGIQREQATIR